LTIRTLRSSTLVRLAIGCGAEFSKKWLLPNPSEIVERRDESDIDLSADRGDRSQEPLMRSRGVDEEFGVTDGVLKGEGIVGRCRFGSGSY
jgi:hypothetical protein